MVIGEKGHALLRVFEEEKICFYKQTFKLSAQQFDDCLQPEI